MSVRAGFFLALVFFSSLALARTELVSSRDLPPGGANLVASVVKVVSKGPPGAPQLASSGLFMRRGGEQFVLTTSHGLYHSNIVGQFFAINAAGDQVPCRILQSSYEIDLTLLQCLAPEWSGLSRFTFSRDTDDYYRPQTHSYYSYWLTGVPAGASRALIESRGNAGEAVFYTAPRRMLVPGVKAHYLVPSDHLEPGMSGGLLILGGRDQPAVIGGLISKSLANNGQHPGYTKFLAGVIPGTSVEHFLTTTFHRFDRGDFRETGTSGPAQPWTIRQDVYGQLDHPLNVRVSQFSYQMAEKTVGSKSYKIIRVLPDENLDLNVAYSPYRGINDFKRTLLRNPGCALSITGEFEGVSDGYTYTHERFFPIQTYESILSLFILSEGQTNWMGLRGALLHIDCPERDQTLARLSSLVEDYKKIGGALPYDAFIAAIEEKILSPRSAELFPNNFVFPLNPRRPCDDETPDCRRVLRARQLVFDIDVLLPSLFRRI